MAHDQTPPPAAPRVDPDRLRRAVHLDVVVVGPDAWDVTGSRGLRRVTRGPAGTVCQCEDAQRYPDRVCKHRLAVTLRRLPAAVVATLRGLVPRQDRPRRKRAEIRHLIATGEIEGRDENFSTLLAVRAADRGHSTTEVRE